MSRTSSTYSKINPLRECVDREHDLLNTRTSLFLLWQSILMAGFAITSAGHGVLILISTLGMVSSVVWLYIGHISRHMTEWYWQELKQIESNLPEEERLYSNARSFREDHQGRIMGLSVTKCLVYIFPTIWAFTWGVAFTLRYNVFPA